MENSKGQETNEGKCFKSRKQNCCLYCRELYSNLAQHLERKHSEETDVRNFLLLPANSPGRREIIDLIRKKGNYESQIYAEQLIPTRNPRKGREIQYMFCPRCKGSYSKRSLRKHYNKCEKNVKKYSKTLTALSRKLTNILHTEASNDLKAVFAHLRLNDDAVQITRWDPLIISYANKLCLKLKDEHHNKEIRAKIRLMGRFLLEMKTICKDIKDFSSIYSPVHYNSVLKAVNNLAHSNPDNAELYKNPAVATSLGTLLKQVGKHFRSYSIQRGLKENLSNIDDFLHLLQEDYGTSINKTAAESFLFMKRKKTIELPSQNDIAKLYDYVCKERKSYYRKLKNDGFSYKEWEILSETTLLSLLIFNRRRVGETERIKIEDFYNIHKFDAAKDKELFMSFNIDEKDAANKYSILRLRGKLGREVNIILEKSAFKCLKMIIRYRKEAEIEETNPYLFGLRGGDNIEHKHLLACDLMRKYSVLCNAENPHLLRGTLLRKHMATQASVLGLTDDDVAHLANHLGHEEKIHRTYYRLPVVTKEITQMSKLLTHCVKSKEQNNDFCRSLPNKNGGEYSSNITENDCVDNLLNKSQENSISSILGNENHDMFQQSLKISEENNNFNSNNSGKDAFHSFSEQDKKKFENGEHTTSTSCLTQNINYELNQYNNFESLFDLNNTRSKEVIFSTMNDVEIGSSIEVAPCLTTKSDGNQLNKDSESEKNFRSPPPSPLNTTNSNSISYITKEINSEVTFQDSESERNFTPPPYSPINMTNSNSVSLYKNTTKEINSEVTFQGSESEKNFTSPPYSPLNMTNSNSVSLYKNTTKKINSEVTFQDSSLREAKVVITPIKEETIKRIGTQHSKYNVSSNESTDVEKYPQQSTPPGHNDTSSSDDEISLKDVMKKIQHQKMKRNICTSTQHSKYNMSSNESSDIEKYPQQSEPPGDNDISSSDDQISLKDVSVPRQKIRRNAWTSPEKAFVKIHFKQYMDKRILPPFTKCKEIIEKYPDLCNRTAKQLYAWLNNFNKRRNRRTNFSPSKTGTTEVKCTRIQWSTPEKNVVKKIFKRYLEEQKLPPFRLCIGAVQQYDALKKRTAEKLYAYINNVIKKAQSKQNNGLYSPQHQLYSEVHKGREASVVRKLFSENIDKRTIPTTNECAHVISESPALIKNKVQEIKDMVKYQIERNRFGLKK